MKKTWIKIKRGLLEPKHRNILGIRVWLYIYMLDKADWDTGTIYEWRDKDEAADLQMPWRTLQQQRQQLAEFGYITCVQRKDHQDIIIHNWTNPREYTGEIYNPTKEQDTENPVPPEMGEGTYEGTNKGSRKPSTLPIGSHITDHSRDEKLAIRKQLEIYFKSTTKLPAPNGNIKEHQKLWWTPPEEIAGLANWNYDRACQIINSSVVRLKNVTISDPHSIVKTARAVYAEGMRNESEPAGGWLT